MADTRSKLESFRRRIRWTSGGMLLAPYMVDFLMKVPTTVGALSSIPLLEENSNLLEGHKYLTKLTGILIGIGSVSLAMKFAEMSCALAILALQKESSRIQVLIDEKYEKTVQEIKDSKLHEQSC